MSAAWALMLMAIAVSVALPVIAAHVGSIILLLAVMAVVVVVAILLYRLVAFFLPNR